MFLIFYLHPVLIHKYLMLWSLCGIRRLVPATEYYLAVDKWAWVLSNQLLYCH